jgi:HAD superfamily hydrolase (TIGR01509 family)
VSLPAPRAILFDLDGTLVDTVGVRIASWERAFAEAGIPTDRSRLAGLMGIDGRLVARETASAAGRVLTADEEEDLDRRSGEVFSEYNIDPQALPGAESLLTELDVRRIPWAIATSSRPDQVAASVRALGLKHPPRIVDASHVQHAKPAPDLLLAGAEQLGIDPTHCWYVGDSTWDMQAARASRMAAVGVTSGVVDAEALRAAGADVVHPHLDDIRADLAGPLEVMPAR